MILLTQLAGSLRSHLTPALLAALVVIATFALPAAPVQAISAYDLPFVSAGSDTWAIDDANVLSRITEGNLSSASQELAAQTGIELRYITVRGLGYGTTIDALADELFTAWFGAPDPIEEAEETGAIAPLDSQANQVLVVLDTQTNKAAVRAGTAASTRLTAEIADSVANATILAPLLEGSKYNQAFSDVKERLVAVLSGQADPGAPDLTQDIDIERNFATAEETEASRGDTTTLVIVLLVLATVVPMLTYYVLYQ